MYGKANWDDIRTGSKHLREINFTRNPDIYTIEENSLFIQTSIENLVQKLIPSRLSKSKFHLPWIAIKINEIKR